MRERPLPYIPASGLDLDVVGGLETNEARIE